MLRIYSQAELVTYGYFKESVTMAIYFSSDCYVRQ